MNKHHYFVCMEEVQKSYNNNSINYEKEGSQKFL